MTTPLSQNNPLTPKDNDPFIVTVSVGHAYSFTLEGALLKDISQEAFVRLNVDSFTINGEFGGDSSTVVVRWSFSNESEVEVLTENAHHIAYIDLSTNDLESSEFPEMRELVAAAYPELKNELKPFSEKLRLLLAQIRGEIESANPDWRGDAIYLVGTAYARVLAIEKRRRTGVLREDRKLDSLEIYLGGNYRLYGPLSARNWLSRTVVLSLWGETLRDEVEIDYGKFIWPEDIRGSS